MAMGRWESKPYQRSHWRRTRRITACLTGYSPFTKGLNPQKFPLGAPNLRQQ